VDDLARVRAATTAVWRADAQARAAGAWEQLGGVHVHTTGIPVQQWNGAFVTEAPLRDGVLADVAAWFAALEMPYGVLVPSELDVVPDGLEPLTVLPLMVCGLPGPVAAVPDGVELRADPTAADLATVQAAAFGDPYALDLAFVAPLLSSPDNLFVAAYEGGRAVACARAAVTGDVAGVYDVAVLPAAQGRGLGSAVTAAALGMAVERGCDLAHLNPSAVAHGVYARLGFTDAPPWQVYAPRS
jgi:GNAT superfamily N-acetyltransferase